MWFPSHRPVHILVHHDQWFEERFETRRCSAGMVGLVKLVGFLLVCVFLPAGSFRYCQGWVCLTCSLETSPAMTPIERASGIVLYRSCGEPGAVWRCAATLGASRTNDGRTARH